jgi:hypothetical protein
MSAKNRTDLKAEVAAWTAMLDLEATHKPTEQNILDSVLLNRDITYSVTRLSAGSETINFTNYDTVHLSTAYDTDITISGLNAGEYKFLLINKTAGVKITFANGIDGTFNNTYVDGLTRCAYMITYKGTYTPLQYFITPLFKTFDYSAIPAPETPTAWQQLSISSPWFDYSTGGTRGGVWYRLHNGCVEIDISIQRTLSYNGTIGILPSGHFPAYTYKTGIYAADAANAAPGFITVRADGYIIIGQFLGGYSPQFINIFISIPLT